MRGSPLLRAFVAFLAILSLGYPLRKVTGTSDAPSAPMVAAPAAANREITLQLTFTAVPRNFVIEHLGKVIWEEAAPQAAMERKVALAFPKEGIELHFKANFAEAETPVAPVAARLKLTDPDGANYERSLWGQGSIDEIAAFP